MAHSVWFDYIFVDLIFNYII